MSAGGGTTTITQADGGAAAAATVDLWIAWRFPNPSAPAVRVPGVADGELFIGRDASCAVRLPGSDISRRHAVVKADPEQGLVIADLGSRNGVRVNGRRVESAPLKAGDVLRLGGWVGIITATPGPIEPIAPHFWGGDALKAALAPATRAARSDLPVILEGETGTGKERAAETIHRWSGRPGPFVAVNCAALPEALAEAELFGYRRGAFTGAERSSPGFFRAAEGGTLLLDEVSDLPLALQAKLLRVLEEREVQPLGETRPVPADVRVLVAVQQPLIEIVRGGRFRADLLARLEGLTVRLPPLRDRREDVVTLFTALLEQQASGPVPPLESDLVERLCCYDWPFNVRELALLAKRLMVVCETGASLGAPDLPERMREGSPAAAPATMRQRGPVRLPVLIAALRTAGGNVSRAAALLGISRQRAYRLMEGQPIDLDALRTDREPPP